MGHGTVADEIKGRAPHGGDAPAAGPRDRGARACASARYLDGSERFLAPETSMEVQAALGSDIALVFDECTPFHVDRDYTARSTERTHRWLERCLDWHAAHGPEGQLVYGIVQGGVYEDLRVASAQTIAASAADGIAIGGSLGADKPQMYEVVGWTTAVLGGERRSPRHLLGIGDVDDLIRGVELGIDTFDCAMPTRLGRHGVALVPDPEKRWRVDLTDGALARERRADHGGLPVPGLRERASPAATCATSRKHRELTGDAAADAAQPRLPRAAHGGPARRRSATGTLAERGGGAAGGRRPRVAGGRAGAGRDPPSGVFVDQLLFICSDDVSLIVLAVDVAQS